MKDPLAGLALLDGVTVVELGDGIAGAVAGAALSTLGARVYKGVGPLRLHGHHTPQIGSDSAIVQTLDRAKTIVGTEAAMRLAAATDIVIVDAIDGGIAEAPSTRALVTITPFGLSGPCSGRPGGELVAAASGGLLATIEPEDGGRPVSPPGFIALRAVGTVAALAALHGLDEVRRSGAPIHVDVSAQEAVAFTAALPECAHVLFNCPGRAGSGRYIAPSGVFPCNDGHIRITAVENHQWAGMVDALGAPDWTAGLEDRPARAEQASFITAQVGAWTATQLKAECAELLQRHGVPATAVNEPKEVLGSPQLLYRGATEEVTLGDHPITVLGPPWQLRLAETVHEAVPGVHGLRVVELTHVLAGPIVGALLGGMGATVVRLEDRDRLDIYRRTGPFVDGQPGEERGAYFAVANHSKASVAVPGASMPEAVAQLLSGCDVLIENVGQGRLDRLGVNTDALAKEGVLTLRVSGFGSDGPMASFRVYANNVQSYGGLTWMTRDHRGAFARFGSVLADPLSSVIGAMVVTAWALGPQRCHGGTADLAMIEVVAGCIAEYVAAGSMGVDIEPPTGNDLGPYSPHSVYPLADGRWMAIAVHNDEEWDTLVEILGKPSTLRHPVWRRGADRYADRRDVDAALELELTKYDTDDLVARLAAGGVRVALVASGSDLVDDEHLHERGYFQTVDHGELGRIRIMGLPWQFANSDAIAISAAPILGSTTLADAVGRFHGS